MLIGWSEEVYNSGKIWITVIAKRKDPAKINGNLSECELTFEKLMSTPPKKVARNKTSRFKIICNAVAKLD